MPQQTMTASQEMTVGGINGGGSSTFLTGTTCTSSGTFVAENKYMRCVIVLAAGEAFPPFFDGKKVYWTSLTSAKAASSTADGGFTSTKVEAGAV
jgi:hypothetical protein